MLKAIIPIAIISVVVGISTSAGVCRNDELPDIQQLFQIVEQAGSNSPDHQLATAEKAFELAQSPDVENSIRFRAYILLVDWLIKTDRNDRAFEKITEAAKFYKESDSLSDQVMFNAQVGHLLVQRGNSVEGIRHLRVAERLADGVVSLSLQVQNLLCEDLRRIGAIPEAIIAGKKAIKIAEKYGVDESIFYTKNKLAASLASMNSLDDAEKIYRQMESFDSDEKYSAITQLGLADVLLRRGEWDQSIRLTEQVMASIGDNDDSSNTEMTGLANYLLARSYIMKQQTELGEKHLSLALTQIPVTNDKHEEAKLVQATLWVKNPLLAQQARATINTIIEETSDKIRRNRAKYALAQADLNAGKFEDAALKYQEISIELQQRRFNETKTMVELADLKAQTRLQITELEAKAAIEKENATLADLRAETFESEAKLIRYSRNVSLGIAVLILMGFFLYFRMVYEHRKTKLLLAQTEHSAEIQKQLDERQRLESIGRLTGSVAHDFNNLLQIFSHSSSVLEKSLGKNISLEQKDALDSAVKTIQTGASITDQLLTFAKQQAIDPAPVTLKELFGSNELLLDTATGDDVEIRYALEEDDLSINIDRARFLNAILNLLLNARDALDGRGIIEVRASKHCNEEVECVRIDIVDHGKGMSPKDCEAAFEPYFTTKTDGTGNGLGLSSVKGFVEQSDGRIEIFSEIGAGTTVSLFFPYCHAKPTEPNEGKTSAVWEARFGSILVVDDNQDVLRSLVLMLETIGLNAVGCPDAEAALETLESQKFQLVISDIRMPGKYDGIELAKLIRKKHNDISVILVSGNHAPSNSGEFMFLRKPYTLSQLKEIVNRAIAASEVATSP